MTSLSAQRRVNVSVRLRPSPGCATTSTDPTTVTHAGRPYAFDAVIAGDQDAAFARLGGPMVDDVSTGFNTCLFAYGQTGSGKTHSIFGTEVAPGVLPRFAAALVSLLDARVERRQVQSYQLFASCVEVYQEEVRDLLAASSSSTLDVIQGSSGYAVVPALSRHRIASVDTLTSLLAKALVTRRVGATDANATSSRSHAIFRLHVTQLGAEVGGSDFDASATFVDLAGSERVGTTSDVSLRAAEGIQINQALLTLGRLLHAVGSPSGDVTGFRESKLTRLLEESIMGNCKLRMLATVSAHKDHTAETTSTLQFATHIRSIRAKRTAVAGIRCDASRADIRALRERLQMLHASLRSAAVRVAEAAKSASDAEGTEEAELRAIDAILFVRRSILADGHRLRCQSNQSPAKAGTDALTRIVRSLPVQGAGAPAREVIFAPEAPLTLDVEYVDETLMIRIRSGLPDGFVATHALHLRLGIDDALAIPIELSAAPHEWISMAGVSAPVDLQFVLTSPL